MSSTAPAARANRRELLTKAVAVAAGAAAASIATVAPAQAADGDPLTLGNAATNTSSTKTLWTNDGTEWTLEIHGNLGLRSMMSGVGASYAVLGETNADGVAAVLGNNDGANGYGVYGQADAVGGIGTIARSDDGTGLKGWTQGGTAVLALAEAPGGVGLDVQGIARFSRSGRATIGAGKRSVTVSVSVYADTTATATMQQLRPGTWIQAVVPHVAKDTITIYLNKAVAKKTVVAWFLIG